MKETSPPVNNNQPAGLPADEVALRERIEKRAYHIWLASGGGHGEHLHHWLRAESEVLRAERQAQAARAASRKSNPSNLKPPSPLMPNETHRTK